MENKVIEKVLIAESQAEKMIEEAKIQATKILQNSENKAESIRSKAIDECKQLIKQNKIHVEETEFQSYNDRLSSFSKECEETSKNDSNIEKAIDLIVKRIV